MSVFWQKISTHKALIPIIIALLIGLNVLQGAFTELFHDEAYYWVWSQDLAWGYYEHPPAIAFFIRLGTILLPNEIGVRLFVIILNAFTVYLLYLVTDKKQPLLFFAMLFAVPFVHIGGILAVPDSPFAFFVALYLFCYKKFSEEDTWLSVLWLSIAVVGMLYSKYHGLMAIFFTLLSSPKLLLNPKFWAVVALSCLLFLPRLYWIYMYGLDTLTYHLLGRSRLEHSTLDYIGGEIGALGGIIGIWLTYEAFFFRAKTPFEKALIWICWGVFGFLLLLSFVQHVEANWAAAAVLPILVMAYQQLSLKTHLFKRFYLIALPTFALLLVARFLLASDFLYKNVIPFKTEFWGWQTWAKNVENIAQDCPVVFENTYQLPSKYRFYAKGKKAITLNNPHYHQNQYDMGEYEAQIQGKRIMCLVSQPFCCDSMKKIQTPLGKDLYYTFIDNFRSFNRVKIAITPPKQALKAGEKADFDLLLTHNYPYSCDFSANPRLEAHFACTFWQNGAFRWDDFQGFPGSLSHEVLTDTLHKKLTIKMPAEAGEYEMAINLHYGNAFSGYQAPKMKIRMEK